MLNKIVEPIHPDVWSFRVLVLSCFRDVLDASASLRDSIEGSYSELPTILVGFAVSACWV